MTDAPTTEPAARDDRSSRAGRLDRRFALALVPAVVLVGVAAAAAAGLFADRAPQAPPVRELGGVRWESTDVERSGSDMGYTIRASVVDDRLDGDGATPESHYVLWMLGDGTYDDRPHVDSRSDERMLGMSHEQVVPIVPIDVSEEAMALIDSGTYTPSVDGSITYRDIPAGEYELRALVLREGGVWDGSIATRRVVVE